MRLVFLIATLVPSLVGCATPSQSDLDAEVKRLCAIDGGVRVYAKVKLSADKFDHKGRIRIFEQAGGENALGPQFRYAETIQYYKRGEDREAAMWRTHIQVFRRSDMKLLGESVSYTRRGGDIPGPWHPSHVTCPALKDLGLLEQIFVAH